MIELDYVEENAEASFPVRRGVKMTAAELPGADTAFLPHDAIKPKLREILLSASTVDIAVAYWGDHAIEELTDGKWSKPTHIICNLMSGFCHVKTIKDLQATPGVEVKVVDRLHAKDYWTPQAAIVGSANAVDADALTP